MHEKIYRHWVKIKNSMLNVMIFTYMQNTHTRTHLLQGLLLQMNNQCLLSDLAHLGWAYLPMPLNFELYVCEYIYMCVGYFKIGKQIKQIPIHVANCTCSIFVEIKMRRTSIWCCSALALATALAAAALPTTCRRTPQASSRSTSPVNHLSASRWLGDPGGLS